MTSYRAPVVGMERFKPLTEVLEFNTDFVDQRASQILGLAPETPLVYLERLRSVEEGPMSILRNWLPPMWAIFHVSNCQPTGWRRQAMDMKMRCCLIRSKRSRSIFVLR